MGLVLAQLTIQSYTDYVNIGPRFSNIVLQTLKVLLKKHPPHVSELVIGCNLIDLVRRYKLPVAYAM